MKSESVMAALSLTFPSFWGSWSHNALQKIPLLLHSTLYCIFTFFEGGGGLQLRLVQLQCNGWGQDSYNHVCLLVPLVCFGWSSYWKMHPFSDLRCRTWCRTTVNVYWWTLLTKVVLTMLQDKMLLQCFQIAWLAAQKNSVSLSKSIKCSAQEWCSAD